MQTLGRLKDPRAATALTDAFYKANNFAPDATTMLRCHALKSLGETGNSTGVELLVKVVREPRSEGTEVERQNAMDVRLASEDARYGFVNWGLVSLGFDGFQDYAWFADRESAYAQWDLPLGEALQQEWRRGQARIPDALEGAQRFAAGEGRHGRF